MEKILPNKKPTALDFIIIAIFLAFALLFIFFSIGGESLSVTVTSDVGETTYPLDRDMTLHISSGGYNYTVEIKDGKAAVTEADCPDGICKNTRPIDRDGGSIICVPGGLLIKSNISHGEAENGKADIIIP